MFYPADKSSLTQAVDRLLARAETASYAGTAIGIIAPHAGYQYSGLTAAHAYLAARNTSFDTIVVVAPSHREYFDGISVYGGSAYATPLGEVGINEDLREQLVSGDAIIEISSSGHGEEHALEVQLPFIQRLRQNISLLPVVMGDQRRPYCTHLGERLAAVLAGSRALLVASSDLSHYHGYDAANDLDRIVIDDVAAFNEKKLMDDLESRRVEACGGGPMVAVMVAARNLGATAAHVLHHCNSGDTGGGRDRVVGYLAASLHRPG
jgi:hypothetical protein